MLVIDWKMAQRIRIWMASNAKAEFYPEGQEFGGATLVEVLFNNHPII